jgi:hypothetical protein
VKLSDAITQIINRCKIDLLSEVDITDNAALTSAFMRAAKEVCRDTYFLYTDYSPLTLTACTTGASAGAVVDLLDLTQSSKQIFHAYGININKCWLKEVSHEQLIQTAPNYITDAATSGPDLMVPIAPSKYRVYNAPNAAAIAGSQAYAVGFYLYPLYVYSGTVGVAGCYGNSSSELVGPEEYHDLIVLRTALNVGEAYLSGDNAKARFGVLAQHYKDKAADYRAFNLSLYHKAQPQGLLGNKRRISSLA